MRKSRWLLITLSFIFFMGLQPPGDSDFGWHLRYGEYFFRTGHVLRDNILSFVWPDYKWVQASWGYDLFLYQLFTHGEFLTVRIATAGITLLTFFVLTHPIQRFSFFQLLFLSTVFLTQGVPLYFSSMRSQTPSALFFALGLVLFYKNPLILPFLFLLWANFHGGFSVGLIVLTLLWFGSTNKKMRALALFLSYLTPLINPWGARIYEETLKHSTNINLTSITEWSPIYKLPVESSILYVITILILFLFIRRRKLQDLPSIIVLLLLTYMAASALRFIILYAIFATFSLARLIPEISFSLFHTKNAKIAGRAILITLLILDMFVFRVYLRIPPRILHFSWNDYCDMPKLCSENLTTVMLADPPKGNGFHPYDYGGYLSWRVPMVKTFLDGRMPAWEENGKTPPIIDGDRVFMDPTPITFRRFENEYNFAWAVIPNPSKLIIYLDQLVANGLWEKRYSDDLFTYYVKK